VLPLVGVLPETREPMDKSPANSERLSPAFEMHDDVTQYSTCGIDSLIAKIQPSFLHVQILIFLLLQSHGFVLVKHTMLLLHAKTANTT